MKQHIVISAVGTDRIGMVHDLSKAIADCGGTISESRMTALGNEFAMVLLVTGNWHTLAKLEGEFKKLGDADRDEHPMAPHRSARARAPTCCRTRSTSSASIRPASSRRCPASSPQRGVDIGEISTRSYAAAHTGAPMFSMQLIVNVPSRLHIGVLREEFMDFCDHQNLDAIFEPVKS